MLFASLRDLVWRRRRFLVALIGTSLVLALTLVLSGVNASFENEAQRTVDAMQATSFLVPDGVAGPFMSSATLPAQQDRPDSASPVAVLRATLVHGDATEEINVLGVVLGSFTLPAVEEGTAPTADGQVSIDRKLGVPLGARVKIGGRDFTVVGRTKGLSYRAGIPVVFMSLPQAQTIGYRGAALAAFTAVRGGDVPVPPGLAVRTPDDAREDLLAPLVNARKTIRLVLALLWVVTALVIGSVVYISALDRVGDFAVMKAIGATNRSLLLGVCAQGLTLSAAAWLLASALSRPLSMGMAMTAEISIAHYLQVGLVAIVIGLAASGAGVRRALTTDPALAFGGA